jgi:hypothetical protein
MAKSHRGRFVRRVSWRQYGIVIGNVIQEWMPDEGPPNDLDAYILVSATLDGRPIKFGTMIGVPDWQKATARRAGGDVTTWWSHTSDWQDVPRERREEAEGALAAAAPRLWRQVEAMRSTGEAKEARSRPTAHSRSKHRATRRYIGDAVVEIEYVGQSGDNRSTYKGVVSVGAHQWPFDELGSGVGYLGDTPEAFDKMAASAISFAAYYTTHNRGDDTPDWAPPPEVADAIEEATSWAVDDQGSYEVRRTPSGRGHVGELKAPSRRREPRRHIARDFESLAGALESAQQQGATHAQHGQTTNTFVYFPVSAGSGYQKVEVFESRGKWHIADRSTGRRASSPEYARPIGDVIFALRGSAHGQTVHDYEAVDNRGRRIAGPFRHYDDAKREADRAGGYVKFAMEARRAPRGGRWSERNIVEAGLQHDEKIEVITDQGGWVITLVRGTGMMNTVRWTLSRTPHGEWHWSGYPSPRWGSGRFQTEDEARAWLDAHAHQLPEPPTRRSENPFRLDKGSVMHVAGELARKVGGTHPILIEGGFRWSERNEAAYFVTHSPEHHQKVVVVISVFADGTVAQDFFSDEGFSATDRYENIVHFLYRTVDYGEMQTDLKWVWETVDSYAESWGADQDVDEKPRRDTGRTSIQLARSSHRPAQRALSVRRRHVR